MSWFERILIQLFGALAFFSGLLGGLVLLAGLASDNMPTVVFGAGMAVVPYCIAASLDRTVRAGRAPFPNERPRQRVGSGAPLTRATLKTGDGNGRMAPEIAPPPKPRAAGHNNPALRTPAERLR